MSVYFKVERFAAKPKIIQIRGIHAELGEDQHGILTCRSPHKPYFSLYCIADNYLLKCQRPGLIINDKALADKEQKMLAENDKILCDDYTFHYIAASNAAEVLAAGLVNLEELVSEQLSEAKDIHLVYQLAGLKRSFPLFAGIDLQVGSSHQAAIHVEFPEVRPLHCSICRQKDGKVTVTALEGQVALEGHAAEETLQIRESSRFQLLPSGLELLIEF